MSVESFLQSFSNAVGDTAWVLPMLAIPAGVIASLVCPCTLAVGVGMVGVSGATESTSRWRGVKVAAALTLGIFVNLAVLGILAANLGIFLSTTFGKYWALTIALASLLATYVAYRAPKVSRENFKSLEQRGIGGAFIFGFVFSSGTSVAPLLTLLAFAASQAIPHQALVLSLFFGIGRVVPIILLGLFGVALVRLTRVGTWRNGLKVSSIVILSLISFYHFFLFIVWM